MTTLYREEVQTSWSEGLTFQDLGIYRPCADSCHQYIFVDKSQSFTPRGLHLLAVPSSYSSSTTRYYQNLYVEHGARGSELIVAPFNQGSQGLHGPGPSLARYLRKCALQGRQDLVDCLG
jgi:fatty acid synthase subunit alpha